MSKANVEVKTNIDEGMEMAKELSGEIPKGLDDAAFKIAKSWSKQAERTLYRHGNIVTGEGANSLKPVNLKKGQAGVLGAKHLQYLETGTKAHYPNTSNNRFVAAARQYGIGRYALAQSIANEGTDPHPWMDETTSKIRRVAGRKTSVELDRAVQRSK